MTDTQNVIAPEAVLDEIRRVLDFVYADVETTLSHRAQAKMALVLASAALHRLPTQSIDWPSLHCRFDRCSGDVVGIYHVPEGCLCWTDPVQALCGQHIITAESTGPITAIVERSTQSTPSTAPETVLELIKSLDALDCQRTPGPWGIGTEVGGDIIHPVPSEKHPNAYGILCWSNEDSDGETNSEVGWRHETDKHFIVALENAWPKLRAAVVKGVTVTPAQETMEMRVQRAASILRELADSNVTYEYQARQVLEADAPAQGVTVTEETQ